MVTKSLVVSFWVLFLGAIIQQYASHGWDLNYPNKELPKAFKMDLTHEEMEKMCHSTN